MISAVYVGYGRTFLDTRHIWKCSFYSIKSLVSGLKDLRTITTELGVPKVLAGVSPILPTFMVHECHAPLIPTPCIPQLWTIETGAKKIRLAQNLAISKKSTILIQ